MSDVTPPTSDPDAALGRLVRQLLTTFDTATAMTPREERSALLTHIVRVAARMVGAGAASLFLIDAERAELTFEVAIGPKADEVTQFRVPLGHGIAGTVAATGQLIAISAPEQDARFASDIARSIGHIPQSILCVPMHHGDQVIGVLEALDKTDRETFTPSDIEILSEFADIAALAVEQAQRSDALRAALADAITSAAISSGDFAPLELLDAILGNTRLSPEHRASLEIAAVISDIAHHGPAEQQLCFSWLRVLHDYIQARDRPYTFGGMRGLPWSQ